MRIISQNGLISVPFEMTAIHVTGTFIRMNMVGDTGKGTIIAEYNTPEKAEKAMRLLHEAYVVNEDYKRLNDGLRSKISKVVSEEVALKYGGVFQFPKEEDL